MNKHLYNLVFAQFLSAFGDNAVLFTVIAMILKEDQQVSWYVPALQSAFLVAYVILTPWVGQLAERRPKSWILFLGNAIKATGTLLILSGVEPLLGYAIVGVGAAAYGPAKYGILPEITTQSQLVKANGWVEGATIAAILAGTVAGARLADYSIEAALITVVVLYLISALATTALPRAQASLRPPARGAWSELSDWMQHFLKEERARLIIVALSLFWACAATLRVALVAWAPEVLGIHTASEIANLTFFMALGIVLGAVLVPRLIPLEKIRRARFFAYLLGLLYIGLSLTRTIVEADWVLLGIGLCGGIFVVPLNAAVQEIGQRTIGSGSAVAVQNFFQNGMILISMAVYSYFAGRHVPSAHIMQALGFAMFGVALAFAYRFYRMGKPKSSA